ncbi:hypothetical protein B1R32_1017 [Abditibacterium utsteinense]|uniref:Uncharacterized protein n=2 Tax=Abditibacterium utsteinense TaxID=1960156 RepID=A0A2S8SWU8_9BACT|nr:hypothetical protein B1R32_1017 [Abditibacterium utsteinense]
MILYCVEKDFDATFSKMKFNLFKASILFVGLLCVAILFVALKQVSPTKLEPWATVAAALAVIASLFSAWTAQRVFEEQKEKEQPYVYPAINIHDRIGLALLKVTNYGGSSAYGVCIKWENAPKGMHTAIPFKSDEGPAIHVLMQGESAAEALNGAAHNFFKENIPAVFKGIISYKNGAGRKFAHPFIVSGEQLRHSLTFITNREGAYDKIADIPKKLDDITGAIEKLS